MTAGWNAGRVEGLGDIGGMRDGRAEHDGRAVDGLLPPMADHLLGDRRAVHDLGDLGHVEVRGGLAHRTQLVLHADVDDEGARRHEMARGDQLAQPDLVADIVEDLAQALAVAPVRRCGDAEDPAVGIGFPGAIDDPAIAVGDRMMRLIDHQQIECRHRLEIGGSGQRRRHGEGRLTGPVLAPGIDDRGRDLGRDPAELCAVLRRELVTVGEDAGFGVAALDGARDHGGERDGLAEAGRGDAERVAVIVERSEAALHEEALARTKAHGADPYCAHAGRPGTGAAAGCGAGAAFAAGG